MARVQAEKDAEAARVASLEERKNQRAASNKKVKQFAKAQGLSIVHEAATPPKEDPLAAENPLSQQYAGRRKRGPLKKRASPVSSPSPPPDDVVEKAEKLGLHLVARTKEKRQEQSAAVANAMKDVEKALDRLPEDALREVLKKRGIKVGPTPGLVARAPRPRSASRKRRGDDPKAVQKFYEAKLKEINGVRAASHYNGLNKSSRKKLFEACKIHINDEETGFASSSLQSSWDDLYMNDIARHPEADSDDEADSAAEEEKGDAWDDEQDETQPAAASSSHTR